MRWGDNTADIGKDAEGLLSAPGCIGIVHLRRRVRRLSSRKPVLQCDELDFDAACRYLSLTVQLAM